MKGPEAFARKLDLISEKYNFGIFRTKFLKKNQLFAYYSFIINGKMTVGIADESAYHSLHTNIILAIFLNFAQCSIFFLQLF